MEEEIVEELDKTTAIMKEIENNLRSKRLLADSEPIKLFDNSYNDTI